MRTRPSGEGGVSGRTAWDVENRNEKGRFECVYLSEGVSVCWGVWVCALIF